MSVNSVGGANPLAFGRTDNAGNILPEIPRSHSHARESEIISRLIVLILSPLADDQRPGSPLPKRVMTERREEAEDVELGAIFREIILAKDLPCKIETWSGCYMKFCDQFEHWIQSESVTKLKPSIFLQIAENLLRKHDKIFKDFEFLVNSCGSVEFVPLILKGKQFVIEKRDLESTLADLMRL